jgi:Tol biopolymer transport system component
MQDGAEPSRSAPQRKEREKMTTINNLKTATILVAVLLAAILLALVVAAQPARAAFPGSTGAIAFVSSREDPRNWQLYRMNADGYGQTKLSNLPGFSYSPAWSADGTKITFSNMVIGAPGEVYQVNADGSTEKNLTNSASDDGGSSYSPTSTNKFAFASNRIDNQFDIYLMELGSNGQTTELIRITRSAGKDVDPVISPDGRRLAFVSDRDGDEDIYVMKLAPEGPTNVPVKLTKNTRPDPNGAPYMIDFEPEWSPDGKQIAFASDRTGEMDIYRMKPSPEGRLNRPVNLTRTPTDREETPAWSPDGKQIAFASDQDGDWEIWRMRAADGANPKNLTNNTAIDMFPDWQPLP